MKKIFTLALSAMMLGGVNLSAQKNYTVLEDLTSKIQNADFSVDTPVSGLEKICTYNYDMTDPGLGAGGVQIFGLQPITGWVANFPTDNVLLENRATTNADAKAGGIFAYIDDASEEVSTGLGGAYYAPYLTEEVTTGQGLGIVAVWGSDAQYTQDMTLPAGAYMMLVKVQNTAGGEAFLHSNIGFVAADGTTYVSGKKSFAVGTWETDTIVFQLETETAGKLSLGYKAGNYGSGGAAHLFIDNVKLCSIDPRPLIPVQQGQDARQHRHGHIGRVKPEGQALQKVGIQSQGHHRCQLPQSEQGAVKKYVQKQNAGNCHDQQGCQLGQRRDIRQIVPHMEQGGKSGGQISAEVVPGLVAEGRPAVVIHVIEIGPQHCAEANDIHRK